MSAADDTTSPIEIATGRRIPWGGTSSPSEPDTPIPRDPSASDLIRQHTNRILEIARTDKPNTEQLAALEVNVTDLAKLADLGARVLGGAQAAGQGGGRGGPFVTLLAACVMSVGIALGIPGLVSTDDAAEARVQLDALTPRIAAIEAEADAEEQRSRRERALTVRWLAAEQTAQCAGIKSIATSVNAIAEATTKGDRRPSPVVIHCGDKDRMPPELQVLVSQSLIEDAGAR